MTAPLPGLRPEQVEWLMITANCLLLQQYPESALTLLEFLLCYEPEHAQALLMLGHCYHLCGRHEEALSSLDRLDAQFRQANPIIPLLKAKALAAAGQEAQANAQLDAFAQALEHSQ
ncbi:MAG: tetratricopeptide repeat protein [Gammaproteobacteria bacterium]|nr:tetratricopeptide repeat protein [Gammaproteobacteria bacterium]MCY4211821.1 tetratricopeptide repeat protein [Gammaproteobacteria bacterium]MCY4282652.1 tetratricopeptide repeat protein [Gammaproteobacteria bacterium]MCY4339104.1 tetratricopeptide repeat protein [Gammaproteobacteria bacterium]